MAHEVSNSATHDTLYTKLAGGRCLSHVGTEGYRGANIWILLTACWGSPYWLTYKQAQELGGQVRKGERSLPVIFWRWLDVEEKDKTGQITKKKIPFARGYRVFNVEQCDGLDEIVTKVQGPVLDQPAEDFDAIEEAEAIVRRYVGGPVIHEGGGAAFYRPRTDTVHMPKRRDFDDAPEYYSALFHELGHSSGHDSRLSRKGVTDPSRFGSHAYSQEELVAEMTAAFLANTAGIETTLVNSAAYIDGWRRKISKDTKLVVMAAQQAQKASDLVLGTEFALREAA